MNLAVSVAMVMVPLYTLVSSQFSVKICYFTFFNFIFFAIYSDN